MLFSPQAMCGAMIKLPIYGNIKMYLEAPACVQECVGVCLFSLSSVH